MLKLNILHMVLVDIFGFQSKIMCKFLEVGFLKPINHFANHEEHTKENQPEVILIDLGENKY